MLKDADATAIYGSRGANGVILITTKRGKKGEVGVNANVAHGYNDVAHKIKLLNTQEYLQMRKEAYFTNDGLTTTSPGYASQYDINGTYDVNKYTDWQKFFLGRSAPLTNASLSVSGASGKSNYLISANFLDEGTVTPGDFGLKRYGIRSNLNFAGLNDRFTASLTINLSRTESQLASGGVVNIFAAPNSPDPYDQYGQLNWANGTFTNPAAFLLRTSEYKDDNLITNFNIGYQILKNLVFKTSLGYNTIRRNEFRKQPLASFNPAVTVNPANRQSNFGNNYNNNLIVEPQINYDNKIGGGQISALLGGSLQHTNSQINVIRSANFTSDDLMENMAAGVTLTNPENAFVQYKYVAIYSRLNYNYADKYFLNLTARRDGSSRFGPGKQFANFGAIGAGWIFSEERFIKNNLSFLSFGKLRGSYGLTGNDQIQDYRYLQLWNTNVVYAGTSTFIPDAAAPNANFAWETNRKIEAAVQLGLFKDRLNLDIAWYRNRSSNQLIYQSLPSSAGQGGSYVNLPAEVQNTGWEFESNLKLLQLTDWNWSMSFNLTIPKNKLLSYEGLETSANASRFEVGQPLDIQKAYNVYVSPETGSYVFEDRNGNGARDLPDQYLIKFLGQQYYGGLQQALKYKQFGLDVLFSFSKQLARSSSGNQPGDFANNPGDVNQFTEVLKRWQKPGDVTTVPKFGTTLAGYLTYSNAGLGNINIVDASFIRLRNIALTYDLPLNFLSTMKIKKVVINLQGQNLFTVTRYIGLDPETRGQILPPLRTILLGLNVTF